MVKLFPVLFFSWFVAANAVACTCEWQGPFSWLTDDADAIVLGEVVAQKGNSFDVFVEQVMKGKELRKVVRIWGDRGVDCRAEVERFPIGTRWVFALDAITEIPEGGFNPSTPNISFGRINDYSIPRCGAYWLKAQGDKLSGNITSMFEWEYETDMTSVRIQLIQDFIDGKAGYADIIGESNEITSGDVMMRRSKKEMGIGSKWEH